LPVPAYKCQGGGDVSVQISVNRKGYVVGASVIESVSSSDECLIRSAVAAAKRSRFRASTSAPEKQVGEIVYRFIAQ
jgi:TonB family protein